MTMNGYSSSSHYDYPADDSTYGRSKSSVYPNTYGYDQYEYGSTSDDQYREPETFHTPRNDRRHTWASPPPPKMSSIDDIVVYDGSSPSSPAPTEVSAYSQDDYNHSYVEEQAIVPYDADQQAMVPYDGSRTSSVANPSSLPPRVAKMKKNRRRATVGAGVVGGVVGLVSLGPVGGVIGGVGAAVATKYIGKRREKKKLAKLSEREIARQLANAPEVDVHGAEFL